MTVMQANGVVARNRISSRGVSRKRSSASRGRVLVIENLRERSRLLSDMLVQERFEVVGVEDARGVLQLLTQAFTAEQGNPPEFVICNAPMLGEAGLELLARLSASHPGVSVSLYSAFSSSKLRERMARVEGAWILDQPFNPEHLRSVLLSVASSVRAAI
jgi:DNA-binding response OmpR family regulator